VARLKQQPGQDLLVYGGGEFVATLIDHDLIDEYRLMVHPMVLGKGRRLFPDGLEKTLRLVHSQTTSTGVACLTFEPAGKGDEPSQR
jgi:dihydrofolate reductase